MSHLHSSFGRTPVRSAIAFAILATIVAGGCASRGPAIARYAPHTDSSDTASGKWGMEAWEYAQAGNRSQVIATLENPPPGLNTDVPELVHAFLESSTQVVGTREGLAKENLEIIASETEFLGGEWVETLTTLSDLHASGIHNQALADAAEDAIKNAMNRTIKAAEEAESDGDYSRARLAWELVGILATSLRDSTSWIRATSHMRAASLPVDWANSEEDPRTSMIAPSPSGAAPLASELPSSYVSMLKMLIARHVDELDWRDLIFAGLEQMALRANPPSWLQQDSTATPGHLKAFLEKFNSIRSEFEIHAIDIDCPPRKLCSTAARLTRKMLESIAYEAAAYGLNFQELGRAFINGAFLLSDIRTRMIWANDVPSLKRQLGEKYVGIGAQVSLDSSGYPVLHPLPGSPARQAGVEDGDRLLAVDGNSTSGQSLDDSVGRVIGQVGTTVELTLQRDAESEVLAVDVQRNVVQRPSVLGWQQAGVTPPGEPRWNWLINRPLGIAYIKIDSFTAGTERGFRTAMDQADRTLGPDRQIEGLVIDLRDNTGGTKDAATRLIDLFLDSGSICATQISGGQTRLERANWKTTRLAGMPLVVLMNDTSASASELLAGTLQGAGDAVVIGEQSYGKGSAQSLIEYQGGILVITTAWFGVPTEGAEIRFIDRSRKPEDWGIIPELMVTTSSRLDEEIRLQRGQWYSYLGEDVPIKGNASGSVLGSKDRALILALALLQARVLPALERQQAAVLSAQ